MELELQFRLNLFLLYIPTVMNKSHVLPLKQAVVETDKSFSVIFEKHCLSFLPVFPGGS